MAVGVGVGVAVGVGVGVAAVAGGRATPHEAVAEASARTSRMLAQAFTLLAATTIRR